ncbi:uncharacterized protein MELLADRAFT_67211 [Melampsora larici-populina 98AG31]|uniref:Uncharacterized protein n=1 Tax=Melampsora larici-populina (strain 98AG31 / pathotype 3-4-7) TaxID=747676 RepID=F4S279_MELLP|nr:uncharacterized protein MELLADRAFT_67211 [Melampsora larici-populina 98AG31]EGG01126.1 hypothetical protein MELLADRAFT_67211 [Melampsora larici-populina 98AG31]
MYYMDIEKALELNPEKKMKLGRSLIDGYQYTTAQTPSPPSFPDAVKLAERELASVEEWNHILNTLYTSWADRDKFDSVCTPDDDESSIAAVASTGELIDAGSDITDYEDMKPQAVNLPGLVTKSLDLSVVEMAPCSMKKIYYGAHLDLASHEETSRTSLPIYPCLFRNIPLDAIIDSVVP